MEWNDRDGSWDTFWARHSNPKSGYSRLLAGPLLLAALYRRSWRLLAVALAYTLVNPILFSPPDEDGVEDDWMHRGVLAERAWVEAGRPVFGRSYPAILNVANVAVFGYTLYAVLARKPIRAAVAYAVSVALKLWFIEALIRWHGSTSADESDERDR